MLNTSLEETLETLYTEGISLDEIEIAYIRLALHKEFKANQAARRLGFSERSLYNKIRNHNILKPCKPLKQSQSPARHRFGQILRQARLKKGLTLSHVAAKFGTSSEAFICLFEFGKRLPKEEYLPIFAKTLSIPLNHLKQAYDTVHKERIENKNGNQIQC
jgi:ribosome-binding protein aMBF1 (putative translation factor)